MATVCRPAKQSVSDQSKCMDVLGGVPRFHLEEDSNFHPAGENTFFRSDWSLLGGCRLVSRPV